MVSLCDYGPRHCSTRSKEDKHPSLCSSTSLVGWRVRHFDSVRANFHVLAIQKLRAYDRCTAGMCNGCMPVGDKISVVSFYRLVSVGCLCNSKSLASVYLAR